MPHTEPGEGLATCVSALPVIRGGLINNFNCHVGLLVDARVVEISLQLWGFAEGAEGAVRIRREYLVCIFRRRYVFEVFLLCCVVVEDEVANALAVEELNSELAENFAALTFAMDADEKRFVLWHRTAQVVSNKYGSIAFKDGYGGKCGDLVAHTESLRALRPGTRRTCPNRGIPRRIPPMPGIGDSTCPARHDDAVQRQDHMDPLIGEAMPAQERASVAGFIQGLREGAKAPRPGQDLHYRPQLHETERLGLVGLLPVIQLHVGGHRGHGRAHSTLTNGG